MTAQLPSRELLKQIIETANEIITVNNGTNEDINKNDTNKIIGLYDHLNDNLANPSVVKVLAEFALAAYEQEPVAMRCKLKFGDAELNDWHYDVYRQPTEFESNRCHIELLYANPAPSIPAVPDIDTWRTAFEYSERRRDDGFNLHKCGEVYESYKTQERWELWLSSRAAMLNGGKS